MVGHLLDVELAALVGLDDEDAVDLEEARDLGVHEVVIRIHRQGGAREARDDEGVPALSRDRALDERAIVVSHVCPDDDRVMGVLPRRRLACWSSRYLSAR